MIKYRNHISSALLFQLIQNTVLAILLSSNIRFYSAWHHKLNIDRSLYHENIELRKIVDMKTQVYNILKKAASTRPTFSYSSILRFTILSLIFVIAFSVRMLPIRWGYYLNEYDPYYQYRQTKYIVENGLMGWLSWHDYLSWYPWGNIIRIHAYPGLPLLAATIYTIMNTLGLHFTIYPTLDPLQMDPVYNFCVIFPVIMGSITCIVIYFLGRELGGEAVGMLSAFFLALDPSHIGRTSLGFFDDETVGILSLLLFIFFFNKSISGKDSESMNLKKTLFSAETGWAVAAGLTLGYLCASWGASRYVVVMTALFALVLLLLRRASQRLLISYAVTFFITISIASCVPRLGSRFPLDYLGTKFNFAHDTLSVYLVFFLLLFNEIIRIKDRSKRIGYSLAVTALLAAGLLFLWRSGKIAPLGAKFIAVIYPSIRFKNPILWSVAEHRASAWGTFYYNFGINTFLLPVGLYFAALMATNLSIFTIIYGLTSAFSASSMIRLNILMSAPMSLLSALAIVRLLRPFILSLRETEAPAPKKYRIRRIFRKETSMAVISLVFILLLLTYVIGTDFMISPDQRRGPRFCLQAYTPTTISSAGLPVRPLDTVKDWLNALTWIRLNTPPSPTRPGDNGTVIASWWDYGYWITAIANRTSLADNGTWNTTQIQQIGRMFMSNEEEAIKILKRYKVTHVLVFTVFRVIEGPYGGFYPYLGGGGDESKWQWMARIAFGPGGDEPFGNLTLGFDYVDVNNNHMYDRDDKIVANEKGQNTTLFKLIHYAVGTVVRGEPYSYMIMPEGKVMTIGYIHLKHFEKAYFSQEYGSITPASGTRYVALVCVYKVNYPSK